MLKTLIKYLISNYLSVALNILKSFALAKILLPESLGAWSLISTFLGYFRYYNLGFNSLAYYRASKTNSVEVYSSLLLRTNVYLTIILGIVYTILFGLTQLDQFANLTYLPTVVLFFLFSIFVTQFSETYIAIYKINAAFKNIALYTNIFSVSSFFLVIIGAYKWGLNGMLIGNLLASLIGLIFLKKNNLSINFKPQLLKSRLKILFIRSSKIILPSLFTVTFSSIDIWMINKRFSLEENGYFSLFQTISSILLLFPSSVAVFYFSNGPNKLLKSPIKVYKLTALNFLITALLCFISYFLMLFFVNNFAPEYEPTIRIFSIISCSIPFLSIRNVIVDIFIARNFIYPINISLFLLIWIKIIVLIFIEINSFYLAITILNISYGIIVLLMFFLYNQFSEKKL